MCDRLTSERHAWLFKRLAFRKHRFHPCEIARAVQIVDELNENLLA
jgi:hypothetical protein